MSNDIFEVETMRTDEEWRNHVAGQLRDGAARMGSIEEKLEENTLLTAELVAIFKACKGGFRVLGWFGSFVKWVGMIAAGLVAIVAAYKQWR